MMKNRKLGAFLLSALMVIVVFGSIPVPAAQDRAESRAPASHVVLAELFTATWCGYCPGADGAMDRIMDDSNYRPNKVALIEWHSNDAYSDADDSARGAYYNPPGISGIPTVIFDGIDWHVGGSKDANNTGIDASYKTAINARPSTTPIKIDVSKTLVGATGTYNVTFTAVDSVLNSSLHGRVILVEDDNDTIDKTKYRFTGKDVLEDQPLSLVNSGDSVTLSGTFTNSYDKFKIAIVAFVQDDSTREVLQSKLDTYPDNFGPTASSSNLDFSMDEDTTDNHLDLDNVFTDPEGDNMVFTITSQAPTSHISASKDGQNVVTFTPDTDWSGTETYKVIADDTYSGNKKASVTFTITVNPINDPPFAEHPFADFSMNEGTTDKHLDLDNVFEDVETLDSDLTFSVSGMDQLTVTINANTHIVSITAPAAYAGVETLVFEAKDEDQAAISDDVQVTVKDVNYAPQIITPMTDITMDEDTTNTDLDLDTIFSDEDGDTLVFTITNNINIGVTVDSENVVTFAPKADWNGMETIVFEATDNIAAPISDSLMVTVNPVNDPPVRTGDLDQIDFQEDGSFQTDTMLNEIFTDVDLNTLDFDIDTQPDNVDVTIESDTSVSFVPQPDWFGTDTVTIVASDGFEQVEYVVNISVEAVNDAPVIDTFTPSTDVIMNEGDSVSFSVVASDVDMDTLTYEWFVGGDKETTDSDSYTYTTGSEDAGPHTVKVKVSDGLFDITHEWKITVKDVNNAPTVSITAPTPTDKVKAGKVTLTADVEDLDGDTVTITWYVNGKAIPDSNKDTMEVKLKAGKTVIKVTVSDNKLSDTDEMTLTVKGGENGNSPGFEFVALMGAMFVVFFALRRKR